MKSCCCFSECPLIKYMIFCSNICPAADVIDTFVKKNTANTSSSNCCFVKLSMMVFLRAYEYPLLCSVFSIIPIVSKVFTCR